VATWYLIIILMNNGKFASVVEFKTEAACEAAARRVVASATYKQDIGVSCSKDQ